MKSHRFLKKSANVAVCGAFSVLCGLVTGFTVFCFKYVYNGLSDISTSIYSQAGKSVFGILGVFVLLVILSLLMIWVHKFVPEVKGGGIARSKGAIEGTADFRPIKAFLGTFFGSSVGYLAGLPSGSEGPAVLIGTSVGGFFTKVFKRNANLKKCVMTGGAGAGFAVATGAVLSGILFSLEEINRKITPTLLFITSVSVVSAAFVNELLSKLFGVSTALFSVKALPILKISHLTYFLLFGIIIGIGVAVFNFCISEFQRIMKKIDCKVISKVKITAVFLLGGVVALTLPAGAFSGHDTVVELITTNTSVQITLLILAVRFFMMLLFTQGGITGGTFVPTLAIGALLGGLAAKLLICFGLSTDYYVLLILLGMCAFIGGTLRAPITASVLFFELTGQITNAGFVIFVIFTVDFITKFAARETFFQKKRRKNLKQ